MRGQDSENYNYCQDVRTVLTGELSFRSCIPVIFNLSQLSAWHSSLIKSCDVFPAVAPTPFSYTVKSYLFVGHFIPCISMVGQSLNLRSK